MPQIKLSTDFIHEMLFKQRPSGRYEVNSRSEYKFLASFTKRKPKNLKKNGQFFLKLQTIPSWPSAAV